MNPSTRFSLQRQQIVFSNRTGITFLILTLAVANATGLCDEDIRIAPLTDDQLQIVRSIQQSTVTSTVAFLASDAMAGRDTPSVELEIASAFVAARFQGAGLELPPGLDSYYQTTQLIQTAPVDEGVQVIVDGNAPRHARLFFGTTADVIIDGTLHEAGDAAASGEAKTEQPWIVDELQLPPGLTDSPAKVAALWARRSRTLAEAGATLVLVRAAQDSPMWELARRLQQHPILMAPATEFQIPVVLVDEDITGGAAVQITIPANRRIPAPVHNVIGVLPGSDAALREQAIIISAHLDHIGTRNTGEDRIHNGADDNATGVTAVLSLADAFSSLSERPARTLIFMTFWGEEKGLLGSKYYVEHPLWPIDQTVANINIEMIGRPETEASNMAWGTGWAHSSLGPQLAAGAGRIGVRIFEHPRFSEMLYSRSDNYSFVRSGVIAHSFSAGSLHSDYHQPSDQIDKLELAHMTRVIQGLFAGILPIAEGQLTPQKTAQQPEAQ